MSKLKIIAWLAIIFFGTVACGTSRSMATPIKVLCLGDSTTQGVNLASPTTDSYPAILGGMLGKRYEVTNAGHTGCTLLKNGDRPYWSQPTFQSDTDLNPDIVIIMLGTNDSKRVNWVHKAEFENDTKAMLAHFVNLSAHPKVLLSIPCPIFAKVPANEEGPLAGQYVDPAVLENEVIPALRRVAMLGNIGLIDIYHVMQTRAADFPDGIHPNARANAVIAKTVYEKIRQ